MYSYVLLYITVQLSLNLTFLHMRALLIIVVSWCVDESKASDCVTNRLLPGIQISCYPIYKSVVTRFTNQLLPDLQIGCYPVYKSVVTRFTNRLLPSLQIGCYPVYKWFVTQL